VTTSRILRHCLIGGAGLAAAALLFVVLGAGAVEFKISLSTAYVSLALLAVTFALGPIYYLTTRRSPASTYLRRDISIWGGAFAIIHVVFGLQVHFAGRMWPYFIFENWRDRSIPVRYDLMGIANYSGAIAALIVLVLLAISNDLSIRKLGLERWRDIQRWGRVFALLTLAHSLVYEVLEKRAAPWVVAVWLIVVAVAGLYVVRAYGQTRAKQA
jgi:sulfoxide reductase heme-binding subunit YedZ